MSRVAKMPVALPKGVECTVAKNSITVKGPKGTLKFAVPQDVQVDVQGAEVQCKPTTAAADKMAGTTRALLANMVKGVSEGYQRKLDLVGVGYRAAIQGKDLNLTLGFSHPVVHQMPKGVKVATPTQTEIVISGIDKQLVGQVAAEVRAHRPPEPYKGKGVRYADEVVELKETKKK